VACVILKGILRNNREELILMRSLLFTIVVQERWWVEGANAALDKAGGDF